MTKTRIRAIEESDYGLYVWELDNGQWIADENKNFLSMPSKKGDEYKLGEFKRFAHDVLRGEGIEPNGKAVFLSGHRRITDDEYEEQRQRQLLGLTPDKFDVGAAQGELAYRQKYGS